LQQNIMITSHITSPGFEFCGTLFLMTLLALIQGLREYASWQKQAKGLAPAAALGLGLFE